MASLKKILEAARLIERTEAPSRDSNQRDSGTTGDADIDAIIRRAAQAEAPPPLPRADDDARAYRCRGQRHRRREKP